MRVYAATSTFVLLCLALSTVAKASEEALRQVIDSEVRAAWNKEKLTPPRQSTDSVFLRRIYLDLVGMIPTYEETTSFLKDKDPKKREKLIDKLLADARYARAQTQLWDVVLLGRNPKNVGHQQNRHRFRQWLQVQFEKNTPYDRLVHNLLAATEEDSRLYYAVYRNKDDLTTATMRTFLGTQLQCAKCHDHPFESWSQNDYYGMAAFFVRTYVVQGEKREDHSIRFFIGEKSTGEVSFKLAAEPGGKEEPVKPKLLNGKVLEELPVPTDFKEPKVEPKKAPPEPLFSRRDGVVDWITSADNPYLARAIVNRIWAQFMGRGFVHPVDDLSEGNKGSHPMLFKELEKRFVANKFDIRWLVREIVNSKAYQIADGGPATEAALEFYERARVRPLSVEELTASLHIATGRGIEAALKSRPSKHMFEYLGDPTDGTGAFQGSISERLFVHNGDTFRGLCRPSNGNLTETLLKSTDDLNAKVERMFLSVLSRKPSDEERERFVKYLKVDSEDKKLASQKMEEAMWVLVSCSEFRFNR